MTVAQIDKPYQVITDRILTLLEQGTVPWHQPWDSVTGLPRNLFSQRRYTPKKTQKAGTRTSASSSGISPSSTPRSLMAWRSRRSG